MSKNVNTKVQRNVKARVHPSATTTLVKAEPGLKELRLEVRRKKKRVKRSSERLQRLSEQVSRRETEMAVRKLVSQRDNSCKKYIGGILYDYPNDTGLRLKMVRLGRALGKYAEKLVAAGEVAATGYNVRDVNRLAEAFSDDDGLFREIERVRANVVWNRNKKIIFDTLFNEEDWDRVK